MCPEIEQRCVIIRSDSRESPFRIIPKSSGGRGRTSNDAVPERRQEFPRPVDWNSRFVGRLRKTVGQNWPGPQPNEAHSAVGKRVANRGPHSQLPASAQTTSGRDSNGPGFGPPI